MGGGEVTESREPDLSVGSGRRIAFSMQYPGSEGIGWGAAAVAGGLVFLAAAEWVARRSPAFIG